MLNILKSDKIILLFLLRHFPNETVSCLALCLDQARSWVMCLVKIIDIFGSLSPCHYLTFIVTQLTDHSGSRIMRRLPDCVYYISTAVVSIATAENTENATNNLIPHLLDRKGFYGNVIVSVNRGNKIRKCYLKKKINVKPHFRNGSRLDL